MIRTRSILLGLALLLGVSGCASQPSHYTPYVAEGAGGARAAGDSELLARVLLLGDAGYATLDPWQPSLEKAASRAALVPEKTTVVMLGDNIYYRGFPQHDDETEPYSKRERTLIDRLEAQLKISAESGAALFVVPGNHDWYAGQVTDQARFVENYGRENALPVSFEPWEQGQPPLPEAAYLDGLTLIFLDTMWLIRGSDADIQRAMQRLDGLLEQSAAQYPGNVVLLAGHHPIESMGPHNKYHTSSLYRFFVGIASVFADIGDQDMSHPDYMRVIEAIEDELADFEGRVVYAAGHDHSLQAFGDAAQPAPQYRLVSGAANSRILTGVGHNDDTLFAVSQEGFLELDIYRRGILLRAYTIDEREPVFAHWLWR